MNAVVGFCVRSAKLVDGILKLPLSGTRHSIRLAAWAVAAYTAICMIVELASAVHVKVCPDTDTVVGGVKPAIAVGPVTSPANATKSVAPAAARWIVAPAVNSATGADGAVV